MSSLWMSAASAPMKLSDPLVLERVAEASNTAPFRKVLETERAKGGLWEIPHRKSPRLPPR